MTHKAIQSLLFKRFAIAAGTYALILLLFWLAVVTGHSRASSGSALLGTGLVLASQGLLCWVFVSGRNLQFADPSLTEVQVVLGIAWQTWLMAHLDQARGVFLVFYLLPLLFGLFHLSRRAYLRSAALIFFCFAGVNLWDAIACSSVIRNWPRCRSACCW